MWDWDEIDRLNKNQERWIESWIDKMTIEIITEIFLWVVGLVLIISGIWSLRHSSATVTSIVLIGVGACFMIGTTLRLCDEWRRYRG